MTKLEYPTKNLWRKKKWREREDQIIIGQSSGKKSFSAKIELMKKNKGLLIRDLSAPLFSALQFKS